MLDLDVGAAVAPKADRWFLEVGAAEIHSIRSNSRTTSRSMTKDEFLALMNFPSEWKEWEMYPDELWQGQIASYVPGDELGSEHDRNEAFH